MNKDNLLKKKSLETFFLFHFLFILFILVVNFVFVVNKGYAQTSGVWVCQGQWSNCEMPTGPCEEYGARVQFDCPFSGFNGPGDTTVCWCTDENSGGEDPAPQPQTPRPYTLICPTVANLSIGESRNLELRYWKSLKAVPNCNTEKYSIRNEEARWNSSNDSIVSVSNEMTKGAITGESSGTATITAIYDGMRTSFPIKVLPPEINLEASSIRVANGEKITLTWAVGEGAKNCIASGGWQGVKNPKGGTEEVTVNFKERMPLKLYMLSCESGATRIMGTSNIETDSVMIYNASKRFPKVSFSLSDAQASENCDEEGNCKVPKDLFSFPLSNDDSLRIGLFLLTLISSLLILTLLYVGGRKKGIRKKE